MTFLVFRFVIYLITICVLLNSLIFSIIAANNRLVYRNRNLNTESDDSHGNSLWDALSESLPGNNETGLATNNLNNIISGFKSGILDEFDKSLEEKKVKFQADIDDPTEHNAIDDAKIEHNNILGPIKTILHHNGGLNLDHTSFSCERCVCRPHRISSGKAIQLRQKQAELEICQLKKECSQEKKYNVGTLCSEVKTRKSVSKITENNPGVSFHEYLFDGHIEGRLGLYKGPPSTSFQTCLDALGCIEEIRQASAEIHGIFDSTTSTIFTFYTAHENNILYEKHYPLMTTILENLRLDNFNLTNYGKKVYFKPVLPIKDQNHQRKRRYVENGKLNNKHQHYGTYKMNENKNVSYKRKSKFNRSFMQKPIQRSYTKPPFVNMEPEAPDEHFYSPGMPFEKQRLFATGFNSSHPTRIVMPGYLAKSNQWWVEAVIRSWILLDPNTNIIKVSWNQHNTDEYSKVVYRMRFVARQIAVLLFYLDSYYKINLDWVQFVGHSLGAQAMGIAANDIFTDSNKDAFLDILKKERIKVFRITGLDPSGPSFTNIKDTLRLDKEDAQFVEAIHTNVGDYIQEGRFGLSQPVGHIDYYPNGETQPGCSVEQIVEKIDSTNISKGLPAALSCNHRRAYLYFIEIIRKEVYSQHLENVRFTRIKPPKPKNSYVTAYEINAPSRIAIHNLNQCPNFKLYKKDSFLSELRDYREILNIIGISMNGLFMVPRIRGMFYFRTRSTFPFLNATQYELDILPQDKNQFSDWSNIQLSAVINDVEVFNTSLRLHETVIRILFVFEDEDLINENFNGSMKLHWSYVNHTKEAVSEESILGIKKLRLVDVSHTQLSCGFMPENINLTIWKSQALNMTCRLGLYLDGKFVEDEPIDAI